MSNQYKTIKQKLAFTKFVQLHKINVSKEKLFKLNMLALVAVCMLGVGYLVEVNKLATKGYEIKSLEKQIVSLEEENKQLQLDAIEGQSFSVLEQRIEELGLVESTKYDYLDAATNVAQAR